METQPTVPPQSGVFSRLSPDKLLLLGLQLLASNAVKTPCAAVQPRPQNSPTNGGDFPSSPVKVVGLESPPTSPEQQVPSNPRKRRRGAGPELSETEKREKRKMMNRVAAQTARDRKKTFVQELESKVASLEAKNQQLLEENKSLRQQTDSVLQENQQLQKQLKSRDSSPSVAGDWLQPFGTGSTSESGSAVPKTSQQQKQILRALIAQWLMTFDPLGDLLQEFLSEPQSAWLPTATQCGTVGGVSHQVQQQHHLVAGWPCPPQRAGMVGGGADDLEPTTNLNPDSLLVPIDTLTAKNITCATSYNIATACTSPVPPAQDLNPYPHTNTQDLNSVLDEASPSSANSIVDEAFWSPENVDKNSALETLLSSSDDACNNCDGASDEDLWASGFADIPDTELGRLLSPMQQDGSLDSELCRILVP